MKKILLVLVLVAFVMSVAGVAHAALPSDPDRRISTYVKVFAGSDVGQTQAVPLTTINANDLIIGWSLTPIASAVGSSYSAGASIYDCGANAIAAGVQIDELEVAAGVDGERIFEYALQIETQLQIVAGDTACTVIIYYEDR